MTTTKNNTFKEKEAPVKVIPRNPRAINLPGVDYKNYKSIFDGRSK